MILKKIQKFLLCIGRNLSKDEPNILMEENTENCKWTQK